MNDFKIIILCGSAGSIDPINELLDQLPSDFSIPIVILIHRMDGCNVDSRLFSNRDIITPVDYQKIESKKIYLAPPLYHLQIERDFSFSFSIDEKVFFSRPSIDVLLTTAAYAYKEQVCVVIYSGASVDGTFGSKEILRYGGKVIVQDLQEADFHIMPKSVIESVDKVEIMGNKVIIEFLSKMKGRFDK